jgi:hypothetical protein
MTHSISYKPILLGASIFTCLYYLSLFVIMHFPPQSENILQTIQFIIEIVSTQMLLVLPVMLVLSVIQLFRGKDRSFHLVILFINLAIVLFLLLAPEPV